MKRMFLATSVALPCFIALGINCSDDAGFKPPPGAGGGAATTTTTGGGTNQTSTTTTQATTGGGNNTTTTTGMGGNGADNTTTGMGGNAGSGGGATSSDRPQRVGAHGAAGDQQRIEVLCASDVECEVDVHATRLLQAVQRRVDRPLREVERPGAAPCQLRDDRVAVRGAVSDDGEQQAVEVALESLRIHT